MRLSLLSRMNNLRLKYKPGDRLGGQLEPVRFGLYLKERLCLLVDMREESINI
jgi:hypothetical protein